MNKKKLTIAHVSAEIEPFSKTGGLANMVSSLAKTQVELGYEVIAVTPFYNEVIATEYVMEELPFKETIQISEGSSYEVSYHVSTISGLRVYFIASSKFFSDKAMYGSNHENLKFLFFDLAVIKLLTKLNFFPHVVHCHDWHSGLIPTFIKQERKQDERWGNTATVFTIHNLVFQMGQDWWKVESNNRDDGKNSVQSMIDSGKIEYINFAKRGILHADTINTVSESYQQEIMTRDFGEDLHRILKNREERFFGIVNGIDFKEFNPLTDPGLFQRYSDKSAERKKANKSWLQEHYGLKVEPDHPLICMSSRISEQKGFMLLMEILPNLLREDVELIIMGDGDKDILDALEKIQKKHPKKMKVVTFDPQRETSIYAGADMFLLPSRFEPCGINQMIAMRYGCVPIVHHIGGLADTIVNFQPETNRGNGFSFKRYESVDLLTTLVRALETYRHKEVWKNLVLSNLRSANSWQIPAKKYIELYKTALEMKQEKEDSIL